MSFIDYLWERRWRRFQGFVIAVILVGGWIVLQNRGYLQSETSACIFELVDLNKATAANEITPGVGAEKQLSKAMIKAQDCAILATKKTGQEHTVRKRLFKNRYYLGYHKSRD